MLNTVVAGLLSVAAQAGADAITDSVFDELFDRKLRLLSSFSQGLDLTTLEKTGHLAAAQHMSPIPWPSGVRNTAFRPPEAAVPTLGQRPRVAIIATAMSDPFTLLGVAPTATLQDIKAAYRKKARRMHPDIDKTPGAADRFLELKEAYQLLLEKSRESRGSTGGFGNSGGYRPSSGGYRPSSSGYRPSSGYRASPSSGGATWTPPPPPDDYSFSDFFRDVERDWADMRKRGRDKRGGAAPKSLWEELEDIGEEFLDYLEGTPGGTAEAGRAGGAGTKEARSSADDLRRAEEEARRAYEKAQEQRRAAEAAEASRQAAKDEAARAARAAAKAKEDRAREIESELQQMKRNMGNPASEKQRRAAEAARKDATTSKESSWSAAAKAKKASEQSEIEDMLLEMKRKMGKSP